jgi:RNA 3'-terminal phosphate cyclase (ATP)
VTTAAAYAESSSPGFVVVAVARYARTRACFDALGERGVPAETVASGVVADFARWRADGAAVDVHLADQVLPFVALAGGRVTVPGVTDHLRTNAAVVRRFGYDVAVRRRAGGAVVSAPGE